VKSATLGTRDTLASFVFFIRNVLGFLSFAVAFCSVAIANDVAVIKHDAKNSVAAMVVIVFCKLNMRATHLIILLD
jgi:hypothetical protein